MDAATQEAIWIEAKSYMCNQESSEFPSNFKTTTCGAKYQFDKIVISNSGALPLLLRNIIVSKLLLLFIICNLETPIKCAIHSNCPTIKYHILVILIV